MEHIAAKTFASQFISAQSNQNQLYTPFQRMVIAIKNNRLQLLHTIPSNDNQVQEKDENGKNLLFYAVYQKQTMPLLYLLMRRLPLEADNQKKNIYHICAYYGSNSCFQIINSHIKLVKVQDLNEKFLQLLQQYNYKRTDAKSGKLKYSVSPQRLKAFLSLQNNLTQLYSQYMKNYLQQHLAAFKEVDDIEQRNPLHLVCLNKYQKCFITLEAMFESLHNPYFMIDENAASDYASVGKIYSAGKMDPRMFVDALNIIENFIDPNILSNIHKIYQRELKKGISEILQAKDKDEQTPLYIASKNGSTKMINFLKKYAPNTKEQQKKQIMKIAGHNLARSHIIDLCQASTLPDIKPLSFLLSCGESINSKKSIYGTFALLEAVKAFKNEKNLEPIKVLLKNGADVNIQDTNGWTVLHHAAHEGQIEVIQLLLAEKEKLGLNQNLFTNKRYHAIHLAAASNHPSIIKYFVEQYKIKIDVVDWDGCTSLHHAAKKGSFEALKELTQLGANIYAVDHLKMSALHHASASNSVNCVKWLLKCDADENKLLEMRNSKGKKAKDLNYNSNQFQTIFKAVREGSANNIRKLVAAHPEMKDEPTMKKQQSPLIVAVIAQQLTSVRFLLELGADTYHEDADGKSALDYAQSELVMAQQKKQKERIKTAKQIKAVLQAVG